MRVKPDVDRFTTTKNRSQKTLMWTRSDSMDNKKSIPFLLFCNFCINSNLEKHYCQCLFYFRNLGYLFYGSIFNFIRLVITI